MAHIFRFTALLMMLFCGVAQLQAQITVHVRSPWRNDPARADSLHIMAWRGTANFPGSKMTSEGNGWFCFTFDTLTGKSDVNFSLYTFIADPGYGYANQQVIQDIKLSAVFANSELETEAYVEIASPTSTPVFSFVPSASKVIYLLNPWPELSPKAVVAGSTHAVQMRLHPRHSVDDRFCGWYAFYYLGETADCRLHFVDYAGRERYLDRGIESGTDFDLSSVLQGSDTVWIAPVPYPDGTGSISTAYPDLRGDCAVRTISAKVRDFKRDGVQFFSTDQVFGAQVVKGIVEETLGPDNKPRKAAVTPSGAAGVDNLHTWFVGEDNDTCIELQLTRHYNGNWIYDSDRFFPIDNFNLYNETFTGMDSLQHNFHFSMELHASFVYRKDTRQQFVFRGDDDVWVFINRKLVIDLGNVHDAWWPGNREKATDTVNLDELGLTDGEIYQIDMFYMERQPIGSNFYMNTSLDLSNEERLLLIPVIVSQNPKVVRYEAKLLLKAPESDDCGVNILQTTQTDAQVDYYISGPFFGTGSQQLNPGTHYGGITIPSTITSVTIDSAGIDGLTYGVYTVTLVSRKNNALKGQVVFTVGGARPVVIVANPPSGTRYVRDTTVVLSTTPADTAAIRLYYRVSNRAADLPSLADTPYVYGQPLTMRPDGSDTTWLHVISVATDEYAADTAHFAYIRDWLQPTLDATPGSGTHFGESLVVTLSTTADSIYYTLDGTLPQPGQGSTLAAGKTVGVTISGDTVMIRAVARGGDYRELRRDFIYYSDRVADIIALPRDTLFVTSVQVTLSVSTPGAEIYYTLDGSDPTQASLRYTGQITLNATTTIKARAFADDRVPSAILVRTYHRLARVIDAVYQDTSGDGSIDRAILVLDTVAGLPDTVRLVNPFSAQDVRAIGVDAVIPVVHGGVYTLVVEIGRQFDTGQRTSFAPGLYGSLSDAGFSGSAFMIGDGVAPILTRAVLSLGVVIRSEPFETERDTLDITFSEPVTGLASGTPFTFRQNGSAYTLNLRFVQGVDQRARYIVESIDPSAITPQLHDSVRIDPRAGIADAGGTVRTGYNRPVALEIKPRPINVRFSAVTLFSPRTTAIKPVYVTEGIPFRHGTTILVDFSVPLHAAAQDIQLRCVIYDCMGNAVASCSGIGTANTTPSMAAVLRSTFITQVVVAWNGTNSDGRMVGIGTYLAVVKVSTPDGAWITRKIKIGVDRR